MVRLDDIRRRFIGGGGDESIEQQRRAAIALGGALGGVSQDRIDCDLGTPIVLQAGDGEAIKAKSLAGKRIRPR